MSKFEKLLEKLNDLEEEISSCIQKLADKNNIARIGDLKLTRWNIEFTSVGEFDEYPRVIIKFNEFLGTDELDGKHVPVYLEGEIILEAPDSFLDKVTGKLVWEDNSSIVKEKELETVFA